MTDLERILDIKLNPLRDDIQELKQGQARMVEVISQLARQDEAMSNLRYMINENIVEDKKTHNALWEEIRKLRTTSANWLWDAIKLIIAAGLGAVMALFSRTQ